jgi:hypothetical protein
MKKLLLAVAALMLLVALLRTAGDYAWWSHFVAALTGADAAAPAQLPEPRLRIAGSAAGLPLATPEAESLLPAALEDARRQAGAQQLAALIVHRHGHRVFEYYASQDENALLGGGELSALPFALSLGVLADSGRVSQDALLQAIRTQMSRDSGWRNPWSAAARARFTLHPAPALLLQDADGDVAQTLSQRVWLPLRAADAWLWGRDDQALRVDCCMVARLDDWMRLGDLLLGNGSYEGERIASPDWIRRLLARDASGRAHPAWLAEQNPWTGDEPPVERDVFWFDLGKDVRMWLAPRRGLQVLVWSAHGRARDTLIPNIILRGLNDQAPSIGGDNLQDLVPGH